MQSVVASFIALFASSVALAAPPSFTVIDLGTLGGAESAAFGLNDLGEVVGWSTVPNGQMHACRWTEGVAVDLGTLGGTQARAWAINNAGVVVGESLLAGGSGNGNFKAFVVKDGTMSALPTLGGNWSVGYAINDAGFVAGIAANASQQEKMVRWNAGQAGNPITNLGPLTTHQRSRGYGINAGGFIAGWGYTPLGGPNDALLYSPPVADIVQIGGFGQFQNAEAYDVSDAGTVVGSSAPTSGGNWNATLWLPRAITTPVILGSFPDYEISELYDINGGGAAVGRAYTFNASAEPSHAIYWDGATLHDLNDLLPEGTEGFLFEARHVNESGTIAGTMMTANGGFRAVLLVPVSAPHSDLDGDGQVSAADLAILLGAWGSAGPGDLDGDGSVGAADLAILLGEWTA